MFGIKRIENKINTVIVRLEFIEETVERLKSLFRDGEGEYIYLKDTNDRIEEILREFDDVCNDLKLNDHVELVDKINEKSEKLQVAYDNLRVILNEVHGDLNIFRLVVNKTKPISKKSKNKPVA